MSAGMHACVGCQEMINLAALICPYCATQQVESRWRLLGTCLKWAGAAVTSISITMGGLTLNSLYSDWRQQRDTVSELVAAAAMLNQNGNHAQAWSMYADALSLSPGAAEARHGQVETAMKWLRHAKIRGEQRFADIVDPLVPVLYRGLAATEGEAAADILAHLGWGEYLKARDRDRAGYRDAFTPGRADVLFDRALSLEPGNIDAHAMWGFWLTLSAAPIAQARDHFEAALEGARTDGSTDRYAEVRQRQINAAMFIVARPSGVTNERRRAAGDELLRIANAMRKNVEPPLDENARYYLFKNYGPMSGAENIEAVLQVLPVDEHLATFAWAFDDMYAADPDRSLGNRNADQRLYVIARLTEESGDSEKALALYAELAELSNMHAKLQVLVDEGLERTSGERPTRAVARNGRKYFDDPLSADDDAWDFHSETLRYFDPAYGSTNADEAIAFFTGLPESVDEERMREVLVLFEESRERIRTFLRDKAEYKKQYGFTTEYSAGHDENATDWHHRLWALVGTFAVDARQTDEAIAELGDLVERLDDVPAAVHYDLARAYSQRAAREFGQGGAESSSESDMDTAITHLATAIESALLHGGGIGWEDIKSDPDLEPLRGDARYLALVRGR